MKIEQMEIRNFRSIEHQVIDFGSYNPLVGPNGAGKSNILAALNVFFQERLNSTAKAGLQQGDFFSKDTAREIEIKLTFGSLSDQAKLDLRHYVRQDKLIVATQATWDEHRNVVDSKQVGHRMIVKEFAPVFEAGSAAERQRKYKELQQAYDLPNETSKGKIEEALRTFEINNSQLCTAEPSNEQFYGFTKGTNLLEKHIQWVYVPAVKDAGSEELASRNTALKVLTQRLIESQVDFSELEELKERYNQEYSEILDSNSQSLKTISSDLTKSVQQWATPNVAAKLEWSTEKQVGVTVETPVTTVKLSDGDFEGQISRFGHGFQRSFLISLLTNLVESDRGNPKTLALGIEEPELYQHPLQIRHIAKVLFELSICASQVFLTTHSPYMIRGDQLETVKATRKSDRTFSTVVSQTTLKTINEKLAFCTDKKEIKEATFPAYLQASLNSQLAEMFFSNKVVFVEGAEDLAFLSVHFKLMDLWDELRAKGIAIIPVHSKSNLLRPYLIAQELKIESTLVFDCDFQNLQDIGSNFPRWDDLDQEEKNRQRKRKEDLEENRRENMSLFKAAGRQAEDGFPDDCILEKGLIAWKQNIGTSFRDDIDPDSYQTIKGRLNGKFSVKNFGKNEVFVSELVDSLWKEGQKSTKLMKVCELILD